MPSTSGGSRSTQIPEDSRLSVKDKGVTKHVTEKSSKVNKGKVLNIIPNVELTNRFTINGESLEDVDTDMDTEHASQNAQKKAKPPPLVVIGSNVSTVQNRLVQLIQSKKFELKLMRVGIRIQFTSNDDYKTAFDALKEDGFGFYSYHNADTRQIKIVLYGLHSMSMDTLKSELAICDVNPIDIKRLNIKKPTYDDQAVYLLYFKAKSIKLHELRQIRSIAYVSVRWDFYRPSKYNNIPQCRNCQMLGHSSVNCNMPSKCLVCSENHKTQDCEHRVPRSQLDSDTDRSYVKCANCGQPHTANYRGCQKRTAFLEARDAISSKRHPVRKPQRQPFNSHTANFPHLTTPAATSYHTRHPQQYQLPLTNTASSWADVVAEPYQESLLTSEQMIQFTMSLLTKLKNCKTREQQLMVAMQVAMEFVNQP